MKATQRKMLRWMLGSGRRICSAEAEETSDADEHSEPEDETELVQHEVAEDWVTWIKRTTRIVESQLDKAQLEHWVKGQRRRYWRWAGQLARMEPGRWAAQVYQWEPQRGQRRVG